MISNAAFRSGSIARTAGRVVRQRCRFNSTKTVETVRVFGIPNVPLPPWQATVLRLTLICISFVPENKIKIYIYITAHSGLGSLRDHEASRRSEGRAEFPPRDGVDGHRGGDRYRCLPGHELLRYDGRRTKEGGQGGGATRRVVQFDGADRFAEGTDRVQRSRTIRYTGKERPWSARRRKDRNFEREARLKWHTRTHSTCKPKQASTIHVERKNTIIYGKDEFAHYISTLLPPVKSTFMHRNVFSLKFSQPVMCRRWHGHTSNAESTIT